jgi:hypothetical protein
VEQLELLKFAVQVLNRLQISHALVGSFASSAWGESRFTQDIDIVVDLKPDQVEPLCKAFPEPEFYFSQTAAREAVERRSQFNVIHPSSGNKIDFMIAGDTSWAIAQLQRSRQVAVFPDLDVNIAAPEDVILGKLLYYKEGGSEKHLRDIASILKISSELVDFEYVDEFAKQLGVTEPWQAVLQRIGRVG